MKNFIAGVIECVIVGGLAVVLLYVLGIETTALQAGIITAGMMVIVGIAGAVKNAITKGGLLYNIEWAIQYNEHSINVKAGNAEELYINGKLTDRKTGISRKAVELKGLLDSGEKVTAVITPAKFAEVNKSGRALRCELFVDGKALQMATA